MLPEHPDRFLFDVIKFVAKSVVALALFGFAGYEYYTIRNAQEKAKHESFVTPTLAVSPTLTDIHIGPHQRQQQLEVVFKNTGNVPIKVGRVDLEVFHREPTLEVQSILAAANYAPPSTLADAPPSGIPPPSLVPTSAKEHLAVRPREGQLYSNNETDSTKWTPLTHLNHSITKRLEIGPGQDWSKAFSFFMQESLNPRWYRFKITVHPAADETEWKGTKIEQIIHGYHAPEYYARDYYKAISYRPVYGPDGEVIDVPQTTSRKLQRPVSTFRVYKPSAPPMPID